MGVLSIGLPPNGCIFLSCEDTQWGLLGVMANAEGRLSQRHEVAILDDLKRVADESGISQTALIAAAIRGLAKTWDQDREITFPFRVVPESRYKQLLASAERTPLLKVADGEADYPAGEKGE